MSLDYIRLTVLPASASLLPEKMDRPEARAMLLAIGLQESRFQYRKQIRGPARGFWQFEEHGGVRGVLNHAVTKPLIKGVLDQLQYSHLIDTSYEAIAHNDVLAACYARLLLWTHRDTLPGPAECDRAWSYYTDTWRPGKPHRSTWDAFFAQAWEELRKL
jgi:hypothetical protein